MYPYLSGQRVGSHRLFVVSPGFIFAGSGSALAHWADDSVRRLSTSYPPFEGDGRTAKAGVQTGDDFRFVRAWREVPSRGFANRIRDRPGRRLPGAVPTHGKRYGICQGGKYSTYYADIYLVVNWKATVERSDRSATPTTGSFFPPVNTSYRFRPGLTWSDRTTSLFSARAMARWWVPQR